MFCTKTLWLDLSENVELELSAGFSLIICTPSSFPEEVLVVFAIAQESSTRRSDILKERFVDAIVYAFSVMGLSGSGPPMAVRLCLVPWTHPPMPIA